MLELRMNLVIEAVIVMKEAEEVGDVGMIGSSRISFKHMDFFLKELLWPWKIREQHQNVNKTIWFESMRLQQ